MRIINGQHKGRRIIAPKNVKCRPTTDTAKEGIFNVITNTYELEDLAILDLFGGMGSIALEFASRGIKDITCVEKSNHNYTFINNTFKELKLEGNIVKTDCFRFIETTNKKYDLIFADPPYDLKNLADIPELIKKNELLHPECWLILEHDNRHDFKNNSYFIKKKSYGLVQFSIFEF